MTAPYKLVPREPTQEMLDAGFTADWPSFAALQRETLWQAMYDAAPPVEQGEGWRDISTAPKDGTPILIGWIDGNGWTERRAWWVDAFECVGFARSQNPKWRGAWSDNAVASFGMEEVHEYQPTHWMPLPPPPTGHREGE